MIEKLLKKFRKTKAPTLKFEHSAELEEGTKVKYHRYNTGFDNEIEAIGTITSIKDDGMITVKEESGDAFMIPSEWVIEEVMKLDSTSSAPGSKDLEVFAEENL